jgi:hypothetical protein
MLCTEFVSAIDWQKRSTYTEHFPVIAYFTRHFGTSSTEVQDTVHYASGEVVANLTPTPHLKGTLKVAKNTQQDGVMSTDPTLTYDVEIYPDGMLNYLMKLDGKALAGSAPTKVQAACVNNVLLVAIYRSEAVSVGVARKPPCAISA